jgi:RING finger/CHY zinc finger protein 1
MSEAKDPEIKHKINRHVIQQVRCYKCSRVQPPQQYCVECNNLFGAYFCSVCNFFDNDTTKLTFHCDSCGVCRRGLREGYIHCSTCGGCFTTQKEHFCYEGSFKDICCVCREEMFSSMEPCEVLNCGHILHSKCFRELLKAMITRCPLCSSSVIETPQ